MCGLWSIRMVSGVCRSHLLCVYITNPSGVAADLHKEFRSPGVIGKCQILGQALLDQ